MKASTMQKGATRAKAAVVLDVETFIHAVKLRLAEMELVADMKRLGGQASKEFRYSFMAGRIAASLSRNGIVDDTLRIAAQTIMAKANPQAKAKAGQTKRTKAEQSHYTNAKSALSYFLKRNGIKAAQPRADAKVKAGTDAKVKAVTPTANTQKTADAFMRQQAAMLQAYAEKNRAMLSGAWLHAIGELVEAMKAIPAAD